jgi:predicted RNA-binding Zn-ribbon protein involved in translation (DUF1610 family)
VGEVAEARRKEAEQVTKPEEDVTVECPNCGTIYTDWWRPSINASLDPEMAADREYMEAASTATCPDCGWTVGFEVLIASRDAGFHAEYYRPPERP